MSREKIGPEYAHKNATIARHVEGLRKLKHGVGRLIRNPSDKGTVYICDSRASNGSKNQGRIKYAIPKHFRKAFLDATDLTVKVDTPPTAPNTQSPLIKWIF